MQIFPTLECPIRRYLNSYSLLFRLLHDYHMRTASRQERGLATSLVLVPVQLSQSRENELGSFSLDSVQLVQLKDTLTLQSTVKNRAKTQRFRNRKEVVYYENQPTGVPSYKRPDRFFPLRQNFKSKFLAPFFFANFANRTRPAKRYIDDSVYHHHHPHHLSFHVAGLKVHCILRSVVHTTNVEFFVFCCFG